MILGAPRKIVILLFRYSVVVKGIERNLTDMGHTVEVLTENFDEIDNTASGTDLFILYLPGEIMDDRIKLMDLREVCEKIKGLNGKMLFIGEKKYHFDLSQALPVVDDYGWLDRPVESTVLGQEVEKAIAGDGTKHVSESERKNIAIARKSIVAARAIKKGERLCEENLTVKPPGTGLSPMLWEDVIGTMAVRDFMEDELIEV